jgi:hypothetical protein
MLTAYQLIRLLQLDANVQTSKVVHSRRLPLGWADSTNTHWARLTEDHEGKHIASIAHMKLFVGVKQLHSQDVVCFQPSEMQRRSITAFWCVSASCGVV